MKSLICLVLFLLVGCTSRGTHERLHATLWVQTAVEFRVMCEQTYRLAQTCLDQALRDPTWSALEAASLSDARPVAVILDVDETVLDNSPASAEMILRNRDFEAEAWDDWVKRGEAEGLPGAREFLAHARRHRVAVFYVTNRAAKNRDVTVENLRRAVDPLVRSEHVLCRGGRSGWTSDKTTRREHVAATYRVLLLLGDDYGDFAELGRHEPALRQELAKVHMKRWGREWLCLPNPNYGNWERCLTGYDNSLSDAHRLNLKRRALRSRGDQ